MNLKTTGTLFDLRIKLTIAVALAFVGILFAYLYFYFPEYRSELTYATALVGGLSVVYTAYYSAITLRTNLKREKLRASHEFCRELLTIDTTRIRVFVEKELNQADIPPSRFYAKVAENHEIHASVRCLLGLLENISVAIQNGYADEFAIHSNLQWVAPWSFQSFRPYIDEFRRKYQAPVLYIELERLVDAWKEGRLLSTGMKI